MTRSAHPTGSSATDVPLLPREPSSRARSREHVSPSRRIARAEAHVAWRLDPHPAGRRTNAAFDGAHTRLRPRRPPPAPPSAIPPRPAPPSPSSRMSQHDRRQWASAPRSRRRSSRKSAPVPELVGADDLSRRDEPRQRRLACATASTDPDEHEARLGAAARRRGRGGSWHPRAGRYPQRMDGKLRLGGMALRNGVLVHGPTSFGVAIRRGDGSIETASGTVPRLPDERLDALPARPGSARRVVCAAAGREASASRRAVLVRAPVGRRRRRAPARWAPPRSAALRSPQGCERSSPRLPLSRPRWCRCAVAS